MIGVRSSLSESNGITRLFLLDVSRDGAKSEKSPSRNVEIQFSVSVADNPEDL